MLSRFEACGGGKVGSGLDGLVGEVDSTIGSAAGSNTWLAEHSAGS